MATKQQALKGKYLNKSAYTNSKWTMGSNNRKFVTPGTVAEYEKNGKLYTTTYGDIDWSKGTQSQKGGSKSLAPPPVNNVIVGKGDEISQQQVTEMKKKGYFQNKTTGKFYDSKGNEVSYTPSTPKGSSQPSAPTLPQPKQSDYSSSKEYAKAIKQWKTSGGPSGLANEPYPSSGNYVAPFSPGTGETPETVFDAGDDSSELEKHMKTYEEQAQEQYEGSYLTFAEEYEKLHGKPAPFKTEKEFLQWRKTQNQEDMDYYEKQFAIQRELEASDAMKAAKQMEGAEASTTAGLSAGREAVGSMGNKMVVSEFAQEMDRQRRQIVLQRQSAENQRQNTLLKLKRAQEKGDMDLVEAIQGQLSSIESDIRRIDTEAMNAATAANEQAMKALEVMSEKTATVSENLFNLGSIAASLSYDQLENMIVGTDMTMPQALAIQQAAVLQGKAAETKNEAEAIKLQAQAQDLLMKAGKTTGQLEYEFVQTLDKDGQAAYVELKRANPNYQFYQQDDGSILWADPQTGETGTAHTPSGGDGEFAGQWGSSNDALNVPDGAPTDPTTGKPAIDSWNGKSGSVQCGQFVNRYTGLGLGNDYASKINAISPHEVSTPQPGDVFISPYTAKNGEDIGHAGFVVGVSDDGKKVTVKDANYGGKGQIQTHEMSTDGMKFGRPSGAGVEMEGLNDIIANAKRFVSAVASKEDVEETIRAYAKEGQVEEMQNYVKGLAFDDVNAEFKKNLLLRANLADIGEDLITKIETYTAKGGDLGIFAGTKQDALNKIGKMDDAEMQAIGQDIRMMVEDFARAQTGAAIQDFERVEFGKIIGSIYDGDELLISKIKSTADYWQKNADNTLKNKIGATAYDSLFPEDTTPEYTFDMEDPLLGEIDTATTNLGIDLTYDDLEAMLKEGHSLQSILDKFNLLTQ